MKDPGRPVTIITRQIIRLQAAGELPYTAVVTIGTVPLHSFPQLADKILNILKKRTVSNIFEVHLFYLSIFF